MAPSEAEGVRGLVARFVAAAAKRGFEEPPPEPPAPSDEPRSPCGLCRGELLVTARAIEGHHAEAAQATAATARLLANTADALRRHDVRWQRPPEAMSFAEKLMSWWNRCVDATTGSPETPSGSGAAPSPGLELVPDLHGAGPGGVADGSCSQPAWQERSDDREPDE